MDSTTDELKALKKAIYEQRKAFDAHIAPLRGDLWRYCRKLTGSVWDGEDLVQETLVRAFGGMSLWSPTSPKAYLFRIASRAWIDKNERKNLDEVPLQEEDATESFADGLSELGIAAMERLTTVLPPRQRVIVLLTQAFEFTAQEAADMLGMSEGAVKAALHRARQALSSTKGETDLKDTGTPEIVQRFVDAFNKKDLEAVCALFDPQIKVDLPGMAEDHGYDEAKRSTMKLTIEDEDANEAVAFPYEGEQAVLLLKHLPDGGKAVSEVLLLRADEGGIVRLRSYYFCPETISAFADAYGVSAHTHGYHF